MSGVGTTALRSILDKPLNQLTEDDISQLTREDCRNYLKQKGMRRPSWNKSQAIQQVISLKALLEPNSDIGAFTTNTKIVSSLPSPNNHNPPRVNTLSVTSNSADSAKEASADVQVSVSAEDSGPGPGMEQVKFAPETEEKPDPNERASPRSHCVNDGSVGQMTIFYSGKVNVYEKVTPEKARAIMNLAATPMPLSRENSFGGTATVAAPPPPPARCFPWNSFSVDRGGLLSPGATTSPMQTEKITDYGQQCWDKENDADGQTSRKVSLQRYREKRKDRLKTKRSMDAYLSHHMKGHIPNSNSSRSSTSSPTQPGQLKMSCFPVDLNEKHNLEC